MGKGKSSKYVTQFKLVMGPRGLNKESNWPSASLGQKQTCSSSKTTRTDQSKEKESSRWGDLGRAHLLAKPHRPKKCFQNV